MTKTIYVHVLKCKNLYQSSFLWDSHLNKFWCVFFLRIHKLLLLRKENYSVALDTRSELLINRPVSTHLKYFPGNDTFFLVTAILVNWSLFNGIIQRIARYLGRITSWKGVNLRVYRLLLIKRVFVGYKMSRSMTRKMIRGKCRLSKLGPNL